MRNEKQQRAWDEVTKAHRALENARYRLVMLPDGQRMHSLEAGVEAAKDTLVTAAAMQNGKEAEARARAAGVLRSYVEDSPGTCPRCFQEHNPLVSCQVAQGGRCGKEGCDKPATGEAHGSLLYKACDEHLPEIQAKVANE